MDDSLRTGVQELVGPWGRTTRRNRTSWILSVASRIKNYMLAWSEGDLRGIVEKTSDQRSKGENEHFVHSHIQVKFL